VTDRAAYLHIQHRLYIPRGSMVRQPILIPTCNAVDISGNVRISEYAVGIAVIIIGVISSVKQLRLDGWDEVLCDPVGRCYGEEGENVVSGDQKLATQDTLMALDGWSECSVGMVGGMPISPPSGLK
jgi:hypothetical protein